MMPKGCSCGPVVDLWCRVHYPKNRVNVRWNWPRGIHQWQAMHGTWIAANANNIGMSDLHFKARMRAKATSPNAYMAWERRQKARQ